MKLRRDQNFKYKYTFSIFRACFQEKQPSSLPWIAANTEATTDFDLSGRFTIQKKDTGISFKYQHMEKVELAHSNYTNSIYNFPKGYINDSTKKERKEPVGNNLFDDTDVLEQRHLPSFGNAQTGMACSFHVSPHGGFENTSDHAYNTEDKIAAQLRGTHLPEKDKCPEKSNTQKSVKFTQKITRSMVEESRTGVPVTSMASDKPDIVKDEIAKGPFYSLNAEKCRNEFTATTKRHVKELSKGNMKEVGEGQVNKISKQEPYETSKGKIASSNENSSSESYLKQIIQQDCGENSKKAGNDIAVDVDAQLNQLLNITADVCLSGKIISEIGTKDTGFERIRKSSKYVTDVNDGDHFDDQVFTPVTTTDGEFSRGQTGGDKARERGRSRKRNTRKNRNRLQSSEERDSAESRCETLNVKQRNDNNADEDIDEIIKFTCEMMEIKQPKLTGKGRRLKSHLQFGVQKGDGSEVNDKYEPITKEEIDKLNRKSEAVFKKRIRELRKSKKKSDVIRIDQDSSKRRKRRQKLLSEDKPPVSPVILADDDVYDISPVKNRETVLDTDTVESDNLCLSPDIKYDRTDIDQTKPSSGISNVRQVKSVIGESESRQISTDSDKVRPMSNCHRNKERETMKYTSKNRKRKKKKSKDRIDKDMNNRVRQYDNQQPCTSSIDIIVKKETNVKPEQGKVNLDAIQRDDIVEISLQHGTEENRVEIPPRRSTPYPRREEVQADLADLIYESVVNSDYSSGSDFPDKTPPVVQPRDINFSLPVADRNINVYSSEDDYDEGDYDEEDVSDDGTEYSEQGSIKKKGKLKKFFEWLFCCTKPRTED